MESSIQVCRMCRTSDFRILTRRRFWDKEYSPARGAASGEHLCHPAPSPAEIAGFYQGHYHVALRTPGGTEQQFGENFRRYRDWVVQFAQSGRSLDTGTATGLFSSMLKGSGLGDEGLEFNSKSAVWGQKDFGIRIRTCDLLETRETPGCSTFISMRMFWSTQRVPWIIRYVSGSTWCPEASHW